VALTWTFAKTIAEGSNPATSKSGSASNVQAGTLLEVCRHLVGHSWTRRDTKLVSNRWCPLLGSPAPAGEATVLDQVEELV
jgi:hypothetical protein